MVSRTSYQGGLLVKRALIAAAVVAAALALLAGPAAAQYGPDGGIVVDDPDPTPGSPVNVTVTGCEPGVDVVVTVDGVSYTGIAGPDGSLTIEIIAPATPGTYEVTSTCGDQVFSTTLTVVGAAAAVTPAAAGTLPRTGSDSLPLAQLGAVLVALGGLVVLATRSWKTRTS